MTELPLVLIIDDEPILRDTLVLILEREGLRATATGDGEEAVQLAEQLHPDIVLCDVLMPGTNGVEIAKQIRKMYPAVPIFLFSGQAAATGLIAGAQAEGQNLEILAKPIRPEVLIDVIRKQLNLTARS